LASFLHPTPFSLECVSSHFMNTISQSDWLRDAKVITSSRIFFLVRPQMSSTPRSMDGRPNMHREFLHHFILPLGIWKNTWSFLVPLPTLCMGKFNKLLKLFVPLQIVWMQRKGSTRLNNKSWSWKNNFRRCKLPNCKRP
jgi:hypothetical protein